MNCFESKYFYDTKELTLFGFCTKILLIPNIKILLLILFRESFFYR